MCAGTGVIPLHRVTQGPTISSLCAANFDHATGPDPQTDPPLEESIDHSWAVNGHVFEVPVRMLQNTGK